MEFIQGGWNAILEYLSLHVLTCLIPALFIAGAIAVFLSQAAVLKYFSSRVKRVVSYGVASVSGTVLAVCSCTVLPLFGGIYKRGAGLGPATLLSSIRHRLSTFWLLSIQPEPLVMIW